MLYVCKENFENRGQKIWNGLVNACNDTEEVEQLAFAFFSLPFPFLFLFSSSFVLSSSFVVRRGSNAEWVCVRVQIDDWMVSKVAQAEQSIIAVVKSFMYDEFVDEKQMDGMGKLDFDELIIGK